MAIESVLQPTSALEAINDMLQSIGQGAINSLESNESVDAANALAILVNTSREVQERGWFFNTDYEYPLTADAAGIITLPPGALQFEADRDWRGRVVERARKLYDRDNHTHVFVPGTVITGRVVWLFNFEDLPQAARTYIHRNAGRVFQAGAVGDQLLYQFTKQKEDEALASLHRAQLRADRSNAIIDNPQTFRIAAAHRRRF